MHRLALLFTREKKGLPVNQNAPKGQTFGRIFLFALFGASLGYIWYGRC